MARYPKKLRTGPWIGWGSLDGNHHGPRIDGEATVLRSAIKFVQLGKTGIMPPPRFSWGLRVWIYASSGRCWNFDIGWSSARRQALADAEADRRGKLYVEQQKALGLWPPKMSIGADYLGEMYAAHGLGLTIVEGPRP